MTILVVGILLAAAAAVLWRISRRWGKSRKILARVVALILIPVSGLLLLLFLFVSLMCGRREYPEVPSPDGLWLAGVSEVDCGGGDHFHSSVQIWRNWQHAFPNPFGGQAHASTIFKIAAPPVWLQLEWKKTDVLVVRYPNDSPIPEEFRCQPQWGDVKIECVSYTPDYSKPVPFTKEPPVKRWFYLEGNLCRAPDNRLAGSWIGKGNISD